MKDKPKQRTVRDFETNFNVWGAPDHWSRHQRYALVEQDGRSRTYRKGSGFGIPLQMLEVSLNGTQYRMEAWIYEPMMRWEMNIASGKFYAWLPRSIAREQTNVFLQMIGQPPVP